MIKIEAVLLNGGGIDSRVVAKMMQDKGYVLHSLFVNANKIREIPCKAAAKKTAELYCVDHFVFDYPVDWYYQKEKKYGRGIALTGWMFFLLGGQYAKFKGCNVVISGLKKEAKNKASEIYIDKLSDLMTTPISVLLPICDKTFEEIVKIAKEKKIPLEDTYSCEFYPPLRQVSSLCKKKKNKTSLNFI